MIQKPNLKCDKVFPMYLPGQAQVFVHTLPDHVICFYNVVFLLVYF